MSVNIYQAFYESLRFDGAATARDMSFRFQHIAFHTCLETLTKLETKGFIKTIQRRGTTLFCIVPGVSPKALAAIKEERIVRKIRRKPGKLITKAVERAVEYLRTHGESTIAQMASGLNISYSHARGIMRRASAARLVRYRVAPHCSHVWSVRDGGAREEERVEDGLALRGCFPGL